LSINFFTQIL